MAKNRIVYNKEEDILYMSLRRASKASIEVGDFIIDIGAKGLVSAIEILNASSNLRIEPGILKSLTNPNKASMQVTYKPNFILLSLSFKIKGKKERITIPLTANLGHKKIREEKTVFA